MSISFVIRCPLKVALLIRSLSLSRFSSSAVLTYRGSIHTYAAIFLRGDDELAHPRSSTLVKTPNLDTRNTHMSRDLCHRQPLCPVVGRRPQHAVSKLPCLVLSAVISCRSSICLGHLSTAWLVSLVAFSCHIWSPSGDTRGPSVVFEAVGMP